MDAKETVKKGRVEGEEFGWLAVLVNDKKNTQWEEE
jgi:hypothetical protein